MKITGLIWDALVKRQSVVLPRVGTIEVKRRRAKRVSETELLPPANVGVFTEDERVEGAASVVNLLADREGVGLDEAWREYDGWLERARREDGSVEVRGVGVIREGRFEGSAELGEALNPGGEGEMMEVERRGRRAGARSGRRAEDGSEGSGGCGRVWCWLGIAVAVLAVVLALVWLCKNGYFEKKVPATEVVAPVAAEPEAVEPEVVVPAVAAGPRYHVIAGAFEIESNADKLVAKVGREYPALTPKKFVDARTGYNMVSIYDGATEREAYNVMNRYWEINPCLWVYKVEL